MTTQASTSARGRLVPGSDADLIEKLRSAPFYHTYQNAFRAATGLPLLLVSADQTAFTPFHTSANQNPFCRALNTGASPCSKCALAQRRALRGRSEEANDVECFAGMRETVIPLKLGVRVVGYLKTGQVFTAKPSAATVKDLAAELRSSGRHESQIEELMRIYKLTPVYSRERYASMVTLLRAFGLQLMTLANQILLEGRSAEPEAVQRAKQFIAERIDEKIYLDAVAAAANVSTFYLCKVFKQSTGMTLTEYVNRHRIQMAKRALLSPNRQITEIAYDVGYQSLSQFNRSFQRIVGKSPSLYRKQMTSSAPPHLVA